MLLQDGDDERAFGVIAHELAFLDDYYYSSLPSPNLLFKELAAHFEHIYFTHKHGLEPILYSEHNSWDCVYSCFTTAYKS